MNTSKFVAITTWVSLLIIIFGILTGFFDKSVTTWFIFLFLCSVGILNSAMNYKK